MSLFRWLLARRKAKRQRPERSGVAVSVSRSDPDPLSPLNPMSPFYAYGHPIEHERHCVTVDTGSSQSFSSGSDWGACDSSSSSDSGSSFSSSSD